MKNKTVILDPSHMEVVRMNPLNASAVSEVIDPYQLYSSLIDNFKQLAIGPFFWFILNFSNWKHVRGGGAITQMIPLNEEAFFDTDNLVLHSITHPDDIPSIMAFTDFWMTYFSGLSEEKRLNTKATLYFRIRNPKHEYYWVMVQYLNGVLNTNNQWMYGLVIATDISHIKKEGVPLMSILDTSDENSQQFFYTGHKKISRKNIPGRLTRREIEILRYLSMGYSSKQIATTLKLSIKTIDNHRQNMLHKTNTKSSAELVNYCVHLGYLYF